MPSYSGSYGLKLRELFIRLVEIKDVIIFVHDDVNKFEKLTIQYVRGETIIL